MFLVAVNATSRHISSKNLFFIARLSQDESRDPPQSCVPLMGVHWEFIAEAVVGNEMSATCQNRSGTGVNSRQANKVGDDQSVFVEGW